MACVTLFLTRVVALLLFPVSVPSGVLFEPASAAFAAAAAAAAGAGASDGFVNRFGQWRATTPPPPPPATPPPQVFRNGGRRQCPPRVSGRPGANVGYERLDPNRCEDGDVGVLADWRPDLRGERRPGQPSEPLLETIQTQNGPLTGFRVTLYDQPGLLPVEWPVNLPPGVHKERQHVYAFLGIPYAQAPIGDARLKPPKAHPGWQQWLALDFGPACPQPARYVGLGRGVRDVDEDCLYLNVYTPQVPSVGQEPHAVLVHIHGGHFTHGSSNAFPGHMLAAWGDVVVVTFNYRLGALGYLSTGDDQSPGNYGLLDQALALRWVHENIHYFNGDLTRVTVFGDDAGAASAALLAVSPLTSQIVHGVIAQSGSPLADWGVITDLERARNTSRVFAERIGCLADTSTKLVSCLMRGRSALEIGDVEFTPDVGMFPWAPVVQTNLKLPPTGWYQGWKQEDWKVLPDTPERLFRQRAFNKDLRLLTGANRDEAAGVIYGNASLGPSFDIDQRWFDERLHEWVLQNNYTLNVQGVERAVRHLYTYWPDDRNTTWIRHMFINFLSDALYRAPVDALVKLALEMDIPTYQYVFNTSVEALRAPFWREVPHGVQHYLLAGAPFIDPDYLPWDIRLERSAWTERDRNMSQLFIEAFSNFAKYGRPTPRQILGYVDWKRALPGDQRFLSINNTFNSTMHSNYRQTETAFWSAYLPTLTARELVTYRPFTEFWWDKPDEPLQIAFWTVTALAFTLLLVVAVLCFLWRNNKRNHDRLYEETFIYGNMGVRENSHLTSSFRKHERFYEEPFMDGNMGVRENAHFSSSISKPPSMATVHDNDISTATNQTDL